MLEKDFVKEVLSIPSYTGHEERVREFLLSFAVDNSFESKVDGFGNVYLTKGKVEDGEYYPCFTAHMDTVHTTNYESIENNERLEIIDTDGVLWCEQGIGGDDKAGIAIILSIMKEIDAVKACFFVQEEPGCIGSENLDEDWFKDVGYVIAYDSPEYNRSAFACSGVMLFDKSFFLEHVRPVFGKFGVDKFYSEPCTDIENIRIKIGVACVNIGAGYHNQHTLCETCVFDEMIGLMGLGKAMVGRLGRKRYDIPCSGKKYDFENEDYRYFSSLSGDEFYSVSADTAEERKMTRTESLIANMYYDVVMRCEEYGIDPNLFEDIFNYYFSYEANESEVYHEGGEPSESFWGEETT